MPDVVVIGAGVAGLSSALVLSRRGHAVTLVERDDTPLPDDAHGAFDWDRRGAPQVRHSHAFLARLRNALRDRYSDVLDALFDAGATELDFIAMLPEGMDRTRRPGDEDLVALACRRTTFEWVLRRIVLAEPHVRLVHGRSVDALMADDTTDATTGPPRVTGVRLDDGTELVADLVIAAGGRRGDVPGMLGRLGVDVDERVEDTGIVYFSRFFALYDDHDYPAQTGPIGGDLGYLKYGVFPGDNRTFSITFAAPSDDGEMRRLLLDPDAFVTIASQVPATAAYVDGRARPITDVFVMAKLLNRRRHFIDDDGNPLVVGFSAVGDAHTCTNPLYGRGCSLAFVQAELLADALDAFPDEPVARATHYELRCDDEVLPWYKAAVAQDAANRTGSPLASGRADTDAAAGAQIHDHDSDTPEQPAENPMRALMRDGLLPALRTDPVVLRAFLRMFNLLERPDLLVTDWDLIGRVMAVYQDRENRPPEPPLGPDRSQMLAATR